MEDMLHVHCMLFGRSLVSSPAVPAFSLAGRTSEKKLGRLVSENHQLLQNLTAAVQRVTAVPKRENVRELERHVDVLLSTYSGLHCSFHMLSPSTPHLLECVAALVGLLGHQNIPLATTAKTISLLHAFAVNNSICKLLNSQFNLLSALSGVLQRAATKDSCTSQCLRLLQRLTYGLSLSCPNGCVEDVIKYIVSMIKSSQCPGEVSLLSLQVLLNLCRGSTSVQVFLKALPSIDEVQRKLLSNLSDGNVTIIMVSLHILAALYLNEELGEKIFSPSNAEQTFQLAFSALSTSPSSPSTARHAADLFIDILSSQRIRKALQGYSKLNKCLEKVAELIPKADGDTVAKVLELCIAFCQVPGVRCFLVKILVSTRDLSVPSGRRKAKNSPFLSLLDWACQSDNAHSTATLAALDLLKEIFEEVLDASLMSSCNECVDVMLPLLVSVLEPPHYSTNEEATCVALKRIYKALCVLSVLWSVETFVEQLSEHVQEELLSRLIQDQLRNNPIAGGLSARETVWSATGINVLLMAFELCLKHRKHSHSVRGLLRQHLQDQRLFPVLAHSLLGCERRHILVALQLIGEACRATDCQVVSLADAIATLNLRQERLQTSSSTQSLAHSLPGSPPRLHSRPGLWTTRSLADVHQQGMRPARSTVSVDSLIEKFKSGLELKELKSSEIIQVYEYKVQAMASKENQLQDLVDAKSQALAQADRLIAQYRGRKAQTDEECLKLRSLLQDAERRCESLKEEISEKSTQQQANIVKLEKLQLENSHLLEVAEEHRQLTQAFRDQTTQLESMQGTVHQKQQEVEQLHNMHRTLQQKSETLKSQHDCAIAQLQEMEGQFQRTNKQLQATDTKCQGLQRALEQSEHKNTTLQNSTKVLEENVKKLTSDLKTARQQNAVLSQESTSLKKLQNSLEGQVQSLKEKCSKAERENAQLQEEVNLFSAVKSLINQREPRTST